MKTKDEIKNILNLRREKFSIRQIAKRLKMAKGTVHRYLKLNRPVEEVQPEPKIEASEVTVSSVDATKNNDIDWSKLYPDETLGITRIGGISPSDYQYNRDPATGYYNNLDDQTPRRRDIRGNQLYTGFNNYTEDINYYHQDYAPRLPGIRIPPRKQQTFEASITEIKKEIDQQNETRILQSLERKIERISESERVKSEMEKKLTIDQNNKTVSDSFNKIATPNLDKKDKITSHGTELQKTTKSVEHTKLTNHNFTYTDKNMQIHDSNNEKSLGLDTNMGILFAANAFIGLINGYNTAADQESNKLKHNYTPPRTVKLVPSQKAKIINPKKVNQHEVKKKNDVYLTPIDN